MQAITKFLNKHMRVLLVTFAIVLSLFFSLAIWFNNNIFDSQNFANKVTVAASQEPVRLAMAQEITDTILQDRPVIKRVAGDRVVSLVSSLLDTEVFSNVLNRLAYGLNHFITGRSKDTIVIDTSGLVQPVTVLVAAIENRTDKEVDITVPEQITLLDASDVPNFKPLGNFLVIAGPLSGILLLVTLGLSLKYFKGNLYQYLNYISATLFVVGLTILVLTHTSGAFLTLQLIDPERSTILSGIYKSFVGSLQSYGKLLILLGLLGSVIAWYKQGGVKKLAKRFAK